MASLEPVVSAGVPLRDSWRDVTCSHRIRCPVMTVPALCCADRVGVEPRLISACRDQAIPLGPRPKQISFVSPACSCGTSVSCDWSLDLAESSDGTLGIGGIQWRSRRRGTLCSAHSDPSCRTASTSLEVVQNALANQAQRLWRQSSRRSFPALPPSRRARVLRLPASQRFWPPPPVSPPVEPPFPYGVGCVQRDERRARPSFAQTSPCRPFVIPPLPATISLDHRELGGLRSSLNGWSDRICSPITRPARVG
jgi:hypothetical protein